MKFAIVCLLFVGCAYALEEAIPSESEAAAAPGIPEQSTDDYENGDNGDNDDLDNERFLGIKAEKPNCWARGLEVACCDKMSFKGHGMNMCVKMNIVPNQLKAVAILEVNGHKVIGKDVSVGSVCAGLPAPVNVLGGACLNIYHADVNIGRKFVDACFSVSISKALTVAFGCMAFNNGHFSFNQNHPAKHNSALNLSFGHGGKPHVAVGNPFG